jgi:CheY-like chemotaxis protein
LTRPPQPKPGNKYGSFQSIYNGAIAFLIAIRGNVPSNGCCLGLIAVDLTATDLAARLHPDLILCDVNLHGTSGIELCDQLKLIEWMADLLAAAAAREAAGQCQNACDRR